MSGATALVLEAASSISGFLPMKGTMVDAELEEVEANVRVLIREEMAVQHRLGEHPAPAPDCAVCRSRTA